MCVDSEKQLTQLLVSLLSGAVAGVIATVVSQVARRFAVPCTWAPFQRQISPRYLLCISQGREDKALRPTVAVS